MWLARTVRLRTRAKRRFAGARGSALAVVVDEAPDWCKAVLIVTTGINMAMFALNKLLEALLYVLKAP